MSDDLVKRFEHLGKAADLLKSQAAEITRLRAELATARREGKEMPHEFLQWVTREMPSGTEIHDPYWWAQRIWAAVIRAAAKEGKP